MLQLEDAIVLVDSGVDKTFIQSGQVIHNIEITNKLEIINVSGLDGYTSHHGTSCARIINNIIPGCRFVSIKILNDRSKAEAAQLVKALEWCINNRARVVNMSLGSVSFNDYDSIRRVVNKAYRQGVIIVAALNNNGLFTYPASFENVIGVKCDRENRLKENDFLYYHTPIDGADFIVSTTGLLDLEKNFQNDFTHINYIDDPELAQTISDAIAEVSNHYSSKATMDLYIKSNSFAAPVITAMAYKLVRKDPNLSFSELKNQLKQKTGKIPINDNLHYTRRLNWIDNCLLLEIGQNEIILKKQFPDNVKYKEYINTNHDISILLQQVNSIVKKYHSLIDAVVIVINPDVCLNKREEERIVMTVLQNSTDFVYINDKSNLKSLKGIGFGNRCWINPGLELLQTSVENSVTIPVLLFNDYTNSGTMNEIFRLQQSFKSKGYCVIVLSASSLGVLYGFEYFPILKQDHDVEEYARGIRSLVKLFDPDLLFIINNCGINDSLYSSVLMEDLLPDMVLNMEKDSSIQISVQKEQTTEAESPVYKETKDVFNCQTSFNISDIDGVHQFILSSFDVYDMN